MDGIFKNGYLTPFGLLPFNKNDKDLINLDRFMSHFSSNTDFLISMFDYDGLPESIDERFIEIYFSSNGSIAAINPHDVNPSLPDELIVITGGRSGEPKNYGLGEKYLGTNNNASIGVLEGTVGVNCVVGYNTSNMAPDFDSYYYARMLMEIEKSIMFNIRFARLAPILKASDAMKREALEELLNNIDDGNMVNIVTSNIVDELRDDTSGGYEAINLTNVDDIKNLQYLIKAYEDILRIFHTKYGQAESGTGKLAQQSVDEINASASSSFVLALDKLKERQKFINAVNDHYGTSITVKFSPAWELEYQRYINRVDPEETIEGPEDKSAEESAPSSADESADASAEEREEGEKADEE